MLEVSTAGRVRHMGKLVKVQRNGKHGRVWYKGKRYDVAKLVRRVFHGPSGKPDWTEQQVFPRGMAHELWFEVSRMALGD